MSKHGRVLDQVKALNGNVHWTKVEALLEHYGATFEERRGSAVAIKLDGIRIVVHRPHPRKECGKGLVKRVKAFLEDCGRL